MEDFFPYADCDEGKFMQSMSPESSDEIRPVSRGAEENCDTTPTAAATSTADQTTNNEQPTEVYSRVKDTSKSSSLPPFLPSRQTEGGNILKKANTMPLQNELQVILAIYIIPFYSNLRVFTKVRCTLICSCLLN